MLIVQPHCECPIIVKYWLLGEISMKMAWYDDNSLEWNRNHKIFNNYSNRGELDVVDQCNHHISSFPHYIQIMLGNIPKWIRFLDCHLRIATFDGSLKIVWLHNDIMVITQLFSYISCIILLYYWLQSKYWSWHFSMNTFL